MADRDSVSKYEIEKRNRSSVPQEDVILCNFIRCALSEIVFHRNIIISKPEVIKRDFLGNRMVNFINVMDENGEIINEAGMSLDI